MYFESSSTVYTVVAQRLPEHPGLVLFAFGLRGAPMSANLYALDREPTRFADFEELFERPSLGEADLWVGFMLLRGALGYSVEFGDLPRWLQEEATRPERLLGERAHLADEVGRWPATWRGQIAALRAGVVGDQADRASR
ncbi:MAG TPA: hypothetical protein VFS21_16640 [Roseiflexaceae bacterium]|nr:hypothetical protein [Roseiflexaceae bacterium]